MFTLYVISVLLYFYVISSVTLHSSAVPIQDSPCTIMLQFPLMETVLSGGAVPLTANGHSYSLVHQLQRGIVIGDISHQYKFKILFSGGLEPFGIPG